MAWSSRRQGILALITVVLAFTVSPVLELAKWLERHGWFGRLD